MPWEHGRCNFFSGPHPTFPQPRTRLEGVRSGLASPAWPLHLDTKLHCLTPQPVGSGGP